MANPLKGETSLKVDGKTLTLALDINAIAELEELVDAGIVDILAWLGDAAQLRAGRLRAILWAALQRHHPEINLMAAGDLVQKLGVGAAANALGSAIEASFPAAETEAENPQKRARPAGTGKRSSSTSSRSGSKRRTTGA